MTGPKIIGNLVIVAYKAKNLPEREIIGKQDPFVVFRIGEATQKTKTDLRGGQHPTWDDQITLPIPEKKSIVLVQVYDEDRTRQELISECNLDITKALQEGEDDNWHPLQFKGREAGEIYLELTFYSLSPPKRTPTRFGMSKKFKPTGGYIPTVPPPSHPLGHLQSRPYPTSSQYPPQLSGTGTPAAAPVPVESHSTPNYPGPLPPQQQHPQFIYNGANTNTPRPYPTPNPVPSMSTGSHHAYPPQQQQHAYPPINSSRPVSFGGQPSSTPVSGSTILGHTPAHLLSSSYNPQFNLDRPNYGGNGGYPPSNDARYPAVNYGHGGGYPPQNNNAGNRNSFPGYPSNPYSTQQQQFGFPEPQQFSGGYNPHSDPLGTPFAAHQGTANQGYPPQQQHQGGGYPSNGHPPY